MEALSAKKIAEIVGGILLSGDGERKITEVSTSSKEGEEATLFVPVIGEKVDAHDFIKDAYRNGMRVTFTSREEVENDTTEMTYIKVDQTVAALQRLGSFYRDQFQIPIIGITGSVGKTTTKEMVAAALSVKYNVLKTIGNMNSQVGLPKMMLKITPEHEIAVIEMGMSMPGEMERLVEIAKPQAVIMTNIGVSHIGQLGSKENIRKEKLNIVNAFNESSVLFLNGEDELLNQVYIEYQKNWNVDHKDRGNIGTIQCSHVDVSQKTKEALTKATIVTFGQNEECTFYAKDVVNVQEETHFTLCIKDKDMRKEEPIILRVLGIHNVLNAVVALAIAYHYGIDPAKAKQGLYEYQPISMRGEIENIKGITLVDDTYNASPDSMRSSIDVLEALPNAKRRIAVLADILELGELSKDCHEEVGKYVATKKVDLLITIGAEAAYIADAVRNTNKNIMVKSFLVKEEAMELILSEMKAGDAIILKGSRGMQLEVITKAIKSSLM